MIRRFYINPLRPETPDSTVNEFIDVLAAADRYILGLRDSSAGLDLTSRTVVWENTFVDEASYTGPYMVHPFHTGSLDNYLMPDSPECITQDTYTVRYQTPDASQSVREGIRRVLLLNIASDAAAATLANLAEQSDDMASSAFGADDVGWVSTKGRTWSHVWEQSFTDLDHLQRYLRSRNGQACSSREGFGRLGIGVNSLQIFACPLSLTPVELQSPAPMPVDDSPALYTITARVAADDVDEYIELLTRLYDPFMEGNGAPLIDRRRSVDEGYLLCEVQSTWRLSTLGAYSDLRMQGADPRFGEFVRDAMPLVRGGTRRFQRDG